MSLFHKRITRYIDENGKQVRKSTPGAFKNTEKSKVWTGRYRDANGFRKEVTLYRDKEASRQKLAELVRKAQQTETGLVSSFEDSAKKTLTEHINDWLATLKARNRSAKHIAKIGGYVRRTADACGWKRLKQLSLSDAERYLAERREANVDSEGNSTPGLSIAASNDHIAALKNFGNWLIKSRPKRWPENPFSGMAKLNSAGDVRLERRPASPDEFPKLLAAAANGEPFRGLSGEDRVVLYLVATETGFRVSELASLTVASLDLSAKIPTITVDAAYSKRRRRDVQPIRSELAERLRKWLESKLRATKTVRLNGHGSTKLWPGTWCEKAAKMLRVDLDAAGIEFEDEHGRLDFHALRGTFATNLATAGVSPKAAQELMRHSDINLTMKVYTNLRLSDVAADLEKLPTMSSVEQNQLRATGTHDQPANNTAERSGKASGSVARLVARSVDESCHRLTTADESGTAETSRSSGIAGNDEVPVLQRLEASCEPLRMAENQEPPVRLELTTYALRKRRSTN
jgi:integrase/recombinase XerC